MMNTTLEQDAPIRADSILPTNAIVATPAGAVPGMPAREITPVEHAIRAGANPAELREILALQRDLDNHRLALMQEQRKMAEEDRKREAALAFARDFAAFRGENIVVPKSKYVDRGKAGSFMQAEYGAVATLLSPALAKHGFSFRHDMTFGAKRWMTEGVESDGPWVYVTCYLMHRDGHTERLDLEGPPGDLHANTPVQNMQATASLLKRQSLLAITGTATQDEDDESQLRPRRQAHRAADEQQEAGADDELERAGHEAAKTGMASLTKWWAGLTPRQQKDMGTVFLQMRKAARQADEAAKEQTP
jgi:hypothetical protein